jgi:hypothetical protein
MDQSSLTIVEAWKAFYIKDKARFWIYHKNGNFGHPLDAQHILNELVSSSDSPKVRHDYIQRLEVVQPARAFLLRDLAGSIHLVVVGFTRIRRVVADYSKESPGPSEFETIELDCRDDEIRLVGHSPDISSPATYLDKEYTVLFNQAAVIQIR